MAIELSGTRARILGAALALFNQRSPAQVTTAEIAAAAGIAEGNLHYHFRRKADLLVALYDAFEADARSVADRSFGEFANSHALLDYLREWFGLMWRHRWYYRDAPALFALAPELRPRLKENTIRLQQLVLPRLAAMAGDGLLVGTEPELQRLLINVWIVSLYWINYLTLLADPEFEEADLDWGFAQVLSLWFPYLSPEGKEIAAAAMSGVPADPLAARALRRRAPARGEAAPRTRKRRI